MQLKTEDELQNLIDAKQLTYPWQDWEEEDTYYKVVSYIVDGYKVGNEYSYESKSDAIKSFEDELSSEGIMADKVDIALYKATVDRVHKEDGTETTTNNGARVRAVDGTVVVTLRDRQVIGREVIKTESLGDHAIRDYR